MTIFGRRWSSILETWLAHRSWYFKIMASMLETSASSRTSTLVIKSLQWMLRMVRRQQRWKRSRRRMWLGRWPRSQNRKEWREQQPYRHGSLFYISDFCCSTLVCIVCRRSCWPLQVYCLFPCRSWHQKRWCNQDRKTAEWISIQSRQCWCEVVDILHGELAGEEPQSSWGWLLGQTTARHLQSRMWRVEGLPLCGRQGQHHQWREDLGSASPAS